MAGSYSHCVGDDGKLLPPEELCSMLECTSGDVYEAIEEMYGMIWYLATFADMGVQRAARTPWHEVVSDPGKIGKLVEQARQRYRDGIASSPGLSDEN